MFIDISYAWLAGGVESLPVGLWLVTTGHQQMWFQERTPWSEHSDVVMMTKMVNTTVMVVDVIIVTSTFCIARVWTSEFLDFNKFLLTCPNLFYLLETLKH